MAGILNVETMLNDASWNAAEGVPYSSATPTLGNGLCAVPNPL
jgi:hypothetical protein